MGHHAVPLVTRCCFSHHSYLQAAMPRYWFADDLPGKLQNWEGVLYLTLFPTSLSSSSWYQQLNFEVCLKSHSNPQILCSVVNFQPAAHYWRKNWRSSRHRSRSKCVNTCDASKARIKNFDTFIISCAWFTLASLFLYYGTGRQCSQDDNFMKNRNWR